MRIIITATGERERQDLEKTNQTSRVNYSIYMPPIKYSRSMKQIPYSSILFKNSRKTVQSTQLFDKDKSNEELLHAKHIKINQSPISTNLINSFSERKFEEGIKKLKNRLKPKSEQESDNMPNFSMKINTQVTPKQHIPIKEIINSEAYKKMMLKLKNEQVVADNNYIMQDRDFRKSNSIRNDFDIKDVLSKQINKNRADFIKYITNKRDLSPIFLRKLSLLDESKVYDLNRICQIIHSNRNKEELFKEKIEGKMSMRENLLVVDANHSLNKIKSDIKMRKTLINDYSKKLIKNPKIDYFYHERTQQLWDRYNVKTLQRKNNSMFKRLNNQLNLSMIH